MTTAHDDDGEQARDARLLAALRHAPDAALEPPAAVSTRILAQAAAAAQKQHAPSWRARWAQAWAPRTPWAAAFGTLAVATLVGVLWSGRDAPTDDSPPPAPSADAVAPPEVLQNKSELPPRPPPPEPAAPAAPAAAKRQAPPPAEAPAAVRGAERRQRAASPEVAPPARAAPPATAASPQPAPPAAASAEAADSASRSERPAVSANAAPRETTRAGALVGRSDPSMRLDAALAAPGLDAAVWRHGGRIHAHGGEQRLWWSQVGDATQGRWQAVTEVRGDLPPAWMVLSIGGERVAAFWFVGDVLWLRDGSGVWRVPVSAEQRRAWQAAPQRW
jgi:hypothetical protein